MSSQYDCIDNSKHEQDAPDEDGFSDPKRIADADSTAVILVTHPLVLAKVRDALLVSCACNVMLH